MISWERYSAGRITMGVFLVLVGVLWLLEMLGYIHFNICIIGPLLLIAAGIFLLIPGRYRDWW